MGSAWEYTLQLSPAPGGTWGEPVTVGATCYPEPLKVTTLTASPKPSALKRDGASCDATKRRVQFDAYIISDVWEASAVYDRRMAADTLARLLVMAQRRRAAKAARQASEEQQEVEPQVASSPQAHNQQTSASCRDGTAQGHAIAEPHQEAGMCH